MLTFVSTKSKNTMAKKFDVISPDGFSIHFSDLYDTKEDAMIAFSDWKKRYEQQGYYSSNRGRIPLNELEQHCKIIEVEE